ASAVAGWPQARTASRTTFCSTSHTVHVANIASRQRRHGFTRDTLDSRSKNTLGLLSRPHALGQPLRERAEPRRHQGERPAAAPTESVQSFAAIIIHIPMPSVETAEPMARGRRAQRSEPNPAP